jgi:hypothetical protein
MNLTAHRSTARSHRDHPRSPFRPWIPTGQVRDRRRSIFRPGTDRTGCQLTTGYPSPDGPEHAPGPLDPYIRKALERSVISVGMGAHLWRVIAEKHPEIWECDRR